MLYSKVTATHHPRFNGLSHLFREHIGKFVHVYLDDTFIYSDTIKDHEKHLRIIMDIL